MEYSVSQFLLLGALTFIFVGAITPLMRKIAINVGAVDAPNLARKAQKEPVPYLGGVAIAIGVVGASYGSLLAVDFSMETFRLASFVLVPAMAISLMGLIDDLKFRIANMDLPQEIFTEQLEGPIRHLTDMISEKASQIEDIVLPNDYFSSNISE